MSFLCCPRCGKTATLRQFRRLCQLIFQARLDHDEMASQVRLGAASVVELRPGTCPVVTGAPVARELQQVPAAGADNVVLSNSYWARAATVEASSTMRLCRASHVRISAISCMTETARCVSSTSDALQPVSRNSLWSAPRPAMQCGTQERCWC